MDIDQRIAEITTRIKSAAIKARRREQDVNLVAVSKLQPDERIEAALQSGLRLFGENRVQEAQSRWAHRKNIYPNVTLHLIGPLQTNKVAEAIALFDVIETVDRPKLVEALAKLAKMGYNLPKLLVQVNTGEEAQKAGVAPRHLPALLELCADHRLKIEGLMCIPPANEEPALHFALLAKLAMRQSLPILSMGMSGDFETAIQFGATHVRVGSALFGER
ncbi:YggS family pyridoxal phosphate-dependent enzyme [Candidatus Phycosocius spiralis]|uniref:Pyridoxal phosphate homeostasis protein n=1 Tax=Candidatus Phycosocius spiralis TaxID=2815099 RepID=A0ABQ4PTM7_9PROT|nr:YggS family pyridoxal phosphate-dependent enzyme [Candidatus Phycosocius spiralis]GIU66371.1 YggS family pyridoxal phosphate enzyme [Candidatus Phycosocius spiralis]